MYKTACCVPIRIVLQDFLKVAEEDKDDEGGVLRSGHCVKYLPHPDLCAPIYLSVAVVDYSLLDNYRATLILKEIEEGKEMYALEIDMCVNAKN